MQEWYVKGHIETVYFQNDSNFYKVLLVDVMETNTTYTPPSIVVTGTFGQVHTETDYIFYGQLVEHAKYGEQFQVTRYEQVSLASKNGLVQYLSGEQFSGIGKVLASRLVEEFGDETIEKIVQNSPRLKTISGLTTQKREMLVETLTKLQGENQTIIRLIKYGFNDTLAYRIYQRYAEQTIATIEANPYVLVESIDGIGFQKADQLGEQLGFSASSRERLCGAIFYTVRELSYTNGNTYYLPDVLLQTTLTILEKSRHELIDVDVLASELIDLSRRGVLIEDSGRFALPSLYYAEVGIASAIETILKQENKSYPKVDLVDEIETIEQEQAITYSDEQKEAIKRALTSPISILTGGPGTGKTTVLNGVVTAFARLNDVSLNASDYTYDSQFPILLGAPTGRAAKRMKELTGLPAMTLHRLLGIGLTGQELSVDSFQPTELEGLLLIIDEMSMVDTWLMNWVLKAVPYGMQVLLVGDKYQLPSVGPGQVLHDLLLSGKVPATELTKVYRQDEQSTVVTLAHDIKDGKVDDTLTKQYKDRSFFTSSAKNIATIVQKVVEKAKMRGYSMRDIQVLAPMYKGDAGINQLNRVIQSVLNPNTDGARKQVEHFEKIFRVGDKVLQLVNQPEQNVFNGDIGEVEAIFYAQETEDKVDELLVSFDGIEVRYKRSEWHNLTLAYCCSIHKSQGSEYPLVILPMVRQYGRMLRRDLLYTAVTRSKKALVLCGEVEAFAQAIQQDVVYRQTLLAEKLGVTQERILPNVEQDEMDQGKRKTNVQITMDKSIVLTEDTIMLIDPMIGMEGITPYDFMER